MAGSTKPPSRSRKPARTVAQEKKIVKRTSKATNHVMSSLDNLQSPDMLENAALYDIVGEKSLEMLKCVADQSTRPLKKQVKIPISTEPLEETCIEREPIADGYIFVPKGDVYITRHCRSKTKESRRTVYVVYDKKGKRSLGIRVPAEIYSTVRDDAAATAGSRADAVKVRDEKDIVRSRQLLLSQFPLIPVTSLEKILEHAFLKGSGRVGRSTKRSDERKAELAVEAHIRHLHTPYDELLDAGTERDKARDMVWDAVQEIKASWGGEKRESPLPTKRKARVTKTASRAKAVRKSGKRK